MYHHPILLPSCYLRRQVNKVLLREWNGIIMVTSWCILLGKRIGQISIWVTVWCRLVLNCQLTCLMVMVRWVYWKGICQVFTMMVNNNIVIGCVMMYKESLLMLLLLLVIYWVNKIIWRCHLICWIILLENIVIQWEIIPNLLLMVCWDGPILIKALIMAMTMLVLSLVHWLLLPLWRMLLGISR